MLDQEPHSILLKSSTRPSSRIGRTIRFAEVTPEDVHVYESAPVSPKRKPLALPPPPDIPDDTLISLGKYKSMKSTIPRLQHDAPQAPEHVQADAFDSQVEPEEGTPEYIRRHFFPSAPIHDPNVEWMKDAPPDPRADTSTTALRFDLTGTPIPESISTTLPTHLGLVPEKSM